MERKVKVNIFLGIVVVLAIIIAIFAVGSKEQISDVPLSDEEYEENIRILSDTIKSLKEDIARYRKEIEKIDFERETIKEELKLIIRDNEKTDTELANGDWDTNIKFLSDFLSKKDSVGE